jgi:chemotaxis protein MotB
MSTYSDLMALLITFFVLLLSMSSLEQSKVSAAASSLRGALGIITTASGMSPVVTKMPMYVKPQGDIDQQIQEQIQNIEDTLAKSNFADLMDIDLTKDVLRINISEAYLFDSGRADIKPIADSVLFEIAKILSWVPFDIQIEGHTDNVPMMGNVRFPSNWELSYGRALSIAHRFMSPYYKQRGIDIGTARFQLIGYGSTRPKAENTTPQGRAANRRVEIVVNLRDDVRKSLVQGD